jgi:hypothetical protein
MMPPGVKPRRTACYLARDAIIDASQIPFPSVSALATVRSTACGLPAVPEGLGDPVSA